MTPSDGDNEDATILAGRHVYGWGQPIGAVAVCYTVYIFFLNTHCVYKLRGRSTVPDCPEFPCPAKRLSVSHLSRNSFRWQISLRMSSSAEHSSNHTVSTSPSDCRIHQTNQYWAQNMATHVSRVSATLSSATFLLGRNDTHCELKCDKIVHSLEWFIPLFVHWLLDSESL